MNLDSHPLVSLFFKDGNLRHSNIGWGYRPSGLRAKLSGNKFLLFEDAPVRSLKPGDEGGIYGVTVDSRGAMFDASGDSDLIEWLQGGVEVEPETVNLLKRYKDLGVSKYNWSLATDTRDFKEGVLLVDQTCGDVSLKYGGISPADFGRMFEDALAENPESVIYVKTHPDHDFREKQSCFSEGQLCHPRVKLLPADLSPADCFKFCSKVYVGTSLMGMEALIHECEVVSYGWNFYAGWGLTTDRGGEPFPPRSRQHSLLELFQAAYLNYSHYYDSETLVPCSLSEIMDHICVQKTHWLEFQGSWSTHLLKRWHKHVLPKFIQGPRTTVVDSENAERILVWGAQEVKSNVAKIVRVEDGFIRSNGLGANFHLPLSLIFDDTGIHFDARSPSRLENSLNESEFSVAQLKDASELREFLCANKLTKYNLGIEAVELPAAAKGKKVILIPGQVDSDASIVFGSPKLRKNRELLEQVRQQHPEAFICYKPHPDLLGGARADKPLWPGIEDQVDFLVKEGDIISWIQAVDEVHTLTSTVGFEALMHGKPVFTYGRPFYAGWGLTNDWLTCERRTRTRTLDELVYAALIDYPTYLNPKTGEYTTALSAAKLLADPDFNYDCRPRWIKFIGFLKTKRNKLRRLLS